MNELFIAYTQRKVISVPDRRYRCLVTLIRSDRPRHWNFSCHNCQSKVVTLMNTEVTAIDDFFDATNTNYAGVGKDCKGTLPTGQACPYTYFFVVR